MMRLCRFLLSLNRLIASVEPILDSQLTGGAMTRFVAVIMGLIGAIAIPEAISTSPVTTESFSTIQYAAPTEPALIPRVPTVPGPSSGGSLAMGHARVHKRGHVIAISSSSS